MVWSFVCVGSSKITTRISPSIPDVLTSVKVNGMRPGEAASTMGLTIDVTSARALLQLRTELKQGTCVSQLMPVPLIVTSPSARTTPGISGRGRQNKGLPHGCSSIRLFHFRRMRCGHSTPLRRPRETVCRWRRRIPSARQTLGSTYPRAPAAVKQQHRKKYPFGSNLGVASLPPQQEGDWIVVLLLPQCYVPIGSGGDVLLHLYGPVNKGDSLYGLKLLRQQSRLFPLVSPET